MKNKNITKGSIWRKWDLQIHAPEANHANQYKPENGSDVWDTYIDYLKKSDVSVFGITDYFSIDGYEKLIKKIENNKDLKDKVFFPNIEFRLDISTNKSDEEVNIHLIFDNNCNLKNIRKFLSKLETAPKKKDGTYYCCTPEDLQVLGYDKASISLDKLEQTLESSFGNEKPYLKVASYRGFGGFIYGNPEKKGESNRKKELSDKVDRFCDFVFGTEKDREWFLKTDRYEDKTIKSIIKPVVTTSDSHSFTDCENWGKKDKMTWIKADKSFEGLRQILFEPKDRVNLGYSKPENKKSYFIIDKVRFIDNTGNTNFMSESIEVNQNLTAIIGGKSTGKSLLLYYISKTIDFQEVNLRLSNHTSPMKYDFDEVPNFDFEVVWADGESSYLKKSGDKHKEGKRKIIYIPQNYLNKLSEKDIKNKETLNTFIKDILLQDENIRDKYDNSNSTIKSLLQMISSNVTHLFQVKQDILEIIENIKKLGEEKGINKYLSELQKKANEIKSKSGLNQKQIEQYEDLLNKGKTIRTKLSVLKEDKKNISIFEAKVVQNIESINKLYNEQVKRIGNVEIKEKFKTNFDSLKNYKTELLIPIKNIISSIDSKIKKEEEEFEKTKKDFIPLMNKVKLQDELKKKHEEIKSEQDKLNKISIERKKLEVKKQSYNTEKTTLIETYRKIFNTYNSIKNELKKHEGKLKDISLDILVSFDNQKFNNEVINECLNKKDIKRVAHNIQWKDEYVYQYEQEEHFSFISKIFSSVFSNKIKTIKNKSEKDVIIKMLEDYFYLDFKISYKNDSLDKMSPGKKGLVLLRLLIDLNNEEWPILLDQPEDDLDNRSVYQNLVSFIKNKKKTRQIIIVTHNPNLVVGADSEEVIVANQEGQEIGRENKKYRFEYVSGALEDSFELSKIKQKSILLRKGIRQHVCEVLEGGKEAFQKREQKYNFKNIK